MIPKNDRYTIQPLSPISRFTQFNPSCHPLFVLLGLSLLIETIMFLDTLTPIFALFGWLIASVAWLMVTTGGYHWMTLNSTKQEDSWTLSSLRWVARIALFFSHFFALLVMASMLTEIMHSLLPSFVATILLGGLLMGVVYAYQSTPVKRSLDEPWPHPQHVAFKDLWNWPAEKVWESTQGLFSWKYLAARTAEECLFYSSMAVGLALISSAAYTSAQWLHG